MPRKKTAGRPALPPGEKASARMGINFKPAEMKLVDQAARLDGYTRTGSWVGDVAVRTAEKVIKEKGAK